MFTLLGKTRYLPLKIFMTYIFITLMLSFFGPIRYYNFNMLIVFLYIFAFICFFVFGYVFGVKSKIDIPRKSFSFYRYIKIFYVLIVIAFTLHIIEFLFNLTKIGLDRLFDSHRGIGYIYMEAIRGSRNANNEVSLIVQLQTLLGIITNSAIVLGLYYYKQIDKILKILFVIFMVVIILNVIFFYGTQKIFGDLGIYILSILLVRNAKNFNKVVFKSLCIVTIMILLFMFIQSERLGVYNIGITNFALHRLAVLNTSHPIVIVFGDYWGLVISILIMYVSMGYYGLSLSLQLPFVFTYGVGNSFALASYVHQYLGVTDILLNTYPLRMQAETSWPALMYWHTIFPWLASDFTFIGTLFFFTFIAFVYAKSWKESVMYQNPVSLIMFANLNIMLVFIPANNQLMQTRESAISTIVLFLFWIMFHKLYNYQVLNERSSTV